MKSLISFLIMVSVSSISLSQTMCLGLFEKKSLAWPTNLETLDFEVLTDFMRSEINALSPRRDQSVKAGKVAWTGQASIKNIYVGQSDIHERFTKFMLDYHKERDRDILDVAIMTMTHLGMDMAVSKIKKSSQMVILIEKTNQLSLLVEQKTIKKAEYNQKLQEILKLITNLVEARQEIFFENTELDLAATAATQKLILGYYKFPTESAKTELLNKLISLNVVGQEQGFRVWLKANATTFGSLAERIQDHLERISENTELDIRDVFTVERIKSALEITMMY